MYPNKTLLKLSSVNIYSANTYISALLMDIWIRVFSQQSWLGWLQNECSNRMRVWDRHSITLQQKHQSHIVDKTVQTLRSKWSTRLIPFKDLAMLFQELPPLTDPCIKKSPSNSLHSLIIKLSLSWWSILAGGAIIFWRPEI